MFLPKNRCLGFVLKKKANISVFFSIFVGIKTNKKWDSYTQILKF
jgi:hypothetical protein